MTDTAPKKGAPSVPLRDRPKRTKADLTDREFATLVLHVSRHCPDRSLEWIENLTWCSRELVLEAYKARPS